MKSAADSGQPSSNNLLNAYFLRYLGLNTPSKKPRTVDSLNFLASKAEGGEVGVIGLFDAPNPH